MKSVGESLKFAWEESGRRGINPIHRSVVYGGAVIKICRMRTTLAIESFTEESYSEISNDTEEHNIKQMVGTEEKKR